MTESFFGGSPAAAVVVVFPELKAIWPKWGEAAAAGTFTLGRSLAVKEASEQ